MTSLKLGGLFEHTVFRHQFHKTIHNILTQFGVSHFTSAESDRNLELIAILKELGGLLDLGIKIANIDIQRETNFLYLDNALILAGFLFSLGLLKAIFAVIHDSTNRRSGLRGNFYQIEILFDGETLGLLGIHDSELFSVNTYQSDFLVPDVLVDGQFLNANVQHLRCLTKKWVQSAMLHTQSQLNKTAQKGRSYQLLTIRISSNT